MMLQKEKEENMTLTKKIDGYSAYLEMLSFLQKI
jgi:hypothetical protein